MFATTGLLWLLLTSRHSLLLTDFILCFHPLTRPPLVPHVTYLDTITLQGVADHFGFSLSYCSRLIKSSTGQSFNAWKRLLRIQKAEHMLRNTTKSVAAISDTLGYENPETFIRAFKKELHTTPAKYRGRYRDTQT